MEKITTINLSKTLDPMEALCNWMEEMAKRGIMGNILLNGEAISRLIEFGHTKGNCLIYNKMVDIYFPSVDNPMRHLIFSVNWMPEAYHSPNSGIGFVLMYHEQPHEPYFPRGDYEYCYMGV